MTYLLDTNAWVRYLRDRNSGVARRMATLRPEEIGLCSIVVGELAYGAHRSSRRADNLALIDQLL